MTLSGTPECQNKTLDATERIDNNTPVFSTKGLYKSQYGMFVAFYNILLYAGCIIAGVVGFGVGAVVWFVLFVLLMGKTVQNQKGMRSSYVDLYDDKMCGLTSDIDKTYAKGMNFTVYYEDITHVDKIANNVVVIRTTHGDYQVQAYQCADKVVSLIEAKKQNLE